MLSLKNRIRYRVRRFATSKLVHREIVATPQAQGYLQQFPWIRHFVPLKKELGSVKIKIADIEAMLYQRRSGYCIKGFRQEIPELMEVYLVDAQGDVVAYVATGFPCIAELRFWETPHAVLRRIGARASDVKFVVKVNNLFAATEIEIYKFPKNASALAHAETLAEEVAAEKQQITEEAAAEARHQVA